METQRMALSYEPLTVVSFPGSPWASLATALQYEGLTSIGLAPLTESQSGLEISLKGLVSPQKSLTRFDLDIAIKDVRALSSELRPYATRRTTCICRK